jgi:ABC-type Fe3+/spermidine/putrescine transport system ATPase subunit
MGVTLDGISYRYDNGAPAVREMNLDIRSGELFGLLGPSGCGKTTTLRMVAGFLKPENGRIEFDNANVTYLAPEERHIGIVFQNYALFPHMTVGKNVAFGLAARSVSRTEQARRVADALALVQLPGMEDRPVTDLSGGQQQRVALARALVIEPTVLLLDEPLSNLDARLRTQTGAELRALQKRLGITTIYVTHDQAEALSLCDRIAVMRDGRIEQTGTPEELYATPSCSGVADFLGGANILPVDSVIPSDDGWCAIVCGIEIRCTCPLPEGPIVGLAVRPHTVIVASNRENENTLDALVVARRFLGSDVELSLDIRPGGQSITVLVRPGQDAEHEVGERIAIHIPPDAVWPLTR